MERRPGEGLLQVAAERTGKAAGPTGRGGYRLARTITSSSGACSEAVFCSVHSLLVVGIRQSADAKLFRTSVKK
jgi:hypothetical protein